MPQATEEGGGTGTKPAGTTTATPKLELDVTKDTVTRGDKVSGLGRVFVHRAANALADDFADIVLAALEGTGTARPRRVRIVGDVASLHARTTLAVLEAELTALEHAVAAVLGDPEPDAPAPPVAHDELVRAVAPTLATGALTVATTAASTVLQGVGALTKLFAHDYQMSGQTVGVDDLGFDLYVAQKLVWKDAEGVTVTVDRVVCDDIGGTDVFRRVAALHRLARTRLAATLKAAATAEAVAKAKVDALQTAVASTQALLAELFKQRQHAQSELGELRSTHAAALSELATARATAAGAEARAAELALVATDVSAFFEDVTSSPTGGASTPLTVAARAERASDDDYVLYVRLLAGGMDEIVDVSVAKSDKWSALAGVTAEFALVRGGVVVTAASRSALQAVGVKLDDVRKVDESRPLYSPIRNFERPR